MDAVASLPPLTPAPQTACLMADPMIGRGTFLGTLGLSVLAAPLAAEGQQAKAPRVGVLALGSAESSPLFEALRQGLRERGWVEGCACGSSGPAGCGAGGVMAWARGRGEGARGRGGR